MGTIKVLFVVEHGAEIPFEGHDFSINKNLLFQPADCNAVRQAAQSASSGTGGAGTGGGATNATGGATTGTLPIDDDLTCPSLSCGRVQLQCHQE